MSLTKIKVLVNEKTKFFFYNYELSNLNIYIYYFLVLIVKIIIKVLISQSVLKRNVTAKIQDFELTSYAICKTTRIKTD